MKMCNELKEEVQLKEKQVETMQQSLDHKDKQINDLRLYTLSINNTLSNCKIASVDHKHTPQLLVIALLESVNVSLLI